MPRRILFLIILISISQSNNLLSSPIFYISPGVRIGWSFGYGVTLAYKISLGVNLDTQLNQNGNYWNITFGYKKRIFKQGSKFLYNHHFFRLEGGFKPNNQNSLFAGAGIGICIFNENIKPMLMTTLDYGALVFASLDMYHSFDTIVQPDLGMLTVLPIPFTKIDSGFN